jgi:hypothetical protein
MQKHNRQQWVGKTSKGCIRVVWIVVVSFLVLLVPHMSVAQDAAPPAQTNRQEQISSKPVLELQAKPVQPTPDSPSNIPTLKNQDFSPALFPRIHTLPSLGLYTDGLRRNKPRPIEAFLRGITTTPHIQGSIYQSMTIEDYSPISRGMYYGAPYYMRAQASTNILMPTLLFVYNYLHE